MITNKDKKMIANKNRKRYILSGLMVLWVLCIAFTASFAEKDIAVAADAGSESPAYTEKGGVVQLTLTTMYNRIKADNDEYQVLAKKLDIYQRRLSVAMHDKYNADNGVAPLAAKAAERIAWEKQRYTDWQYTELEVERYKNDLEEKLDSIKSDLKRQYTNILDLEKNLQTYEDEMVRLQNNIDQLNARIKVGVAKASDMDAYTAQERKLVADVAAQKRSIELAKFNLKVDLKIDTDKDIALRAYESKFSRFPEKDLEKKIKKAIDGSFSVYQNERNLELLREERAIMLQWDKDGVMMTNLQNNEISIREAEYSLVSAKRSEEAGFWSDYYSLLNQDDQIEITKLNLQLAENNYKIVSAKLAQGMATNIEEQDSRISLEEAKTTVQSAVNDYMRMREDFELRLK